MGCHVKSQKNSDVVPCVFPFILRNETFLECATDGNKSYCATKIDEATNEVVLGHGDWGFCKEKYCPSTKKDKDSGMRLKAEETGTFLK